MKQAARSNCAASAPLASERTSATAPGRAPARPGAAGVVRSLRSPRPSAMTAVFFAAAVVRLLAGAAAAGACAIGWSLASRAGVAPRARGPSRSHSRGRTVLHLAVLTSDPPSRRIVGAQLPAGTRARRWWRSASRPRYRPVRVGRGCAGHEPRALRRHPVRHGGGSLQLAPWGLRWYQSSAACLPPRGLSASCCAGSLLVAHGDLLGAQLALTLAGWLGIAIIGPLHTFFRSLTQHGFAIPASSGPPTSCGYWAPSSSLSAPPSLRGCAGVCPRWYNTQVGAVPIATKMRAGGAALGGVIPSGSGCVPRSSTGRSARAPRRTRPGAGCGATAASPRDHELRPGLAFGQPSVHGPERPSGRNAPRRDHPIKHRVAARNQLKNAVRRPSHHTHRHDRSSGRWSPWWPSRSW